MTENELCNFVNLSLILDMHCLDTNVITDHEHSRTKIVQESGSCSFTLHEKSFFALGSGKSYLPGGELETNVSFNVTFFSLLGDSKEPVREENRLRMDDGAARLRARRFRVEEWNRV